MSNLDNLTQKILNDARNKADIIMEESTRKKEEIFNSRVKDANEKELRKTLKYIGSTIFL